MSHQSSGLQNWAVSLDRRLYAILVGVVMGLTGGLIGLMMATLGEVVTIGLALGTLVGLYILTDVYAALYAIIAVMVLIPFGTLPFSVGFKATFLDAAIGAFVMVYLFQWMTGKRRRLKLTPAHAPLIGYIFWLILAFALGLRYAPITATVLRQFTGMILSISLVFIVVDLMRDPVVLRRMVLVVMIVVGVQAFIAITLYILPDDVAETILNRLGRIGYPVGGVIRYIEENPELPERAIGTWIDPNSFGGVLAVAGAMFAPQVFASKPVMRYRWLTLLILGMVALALILTFSRASALALAIGLSAIAFVHYRRFIPILALGFVLLLIIPDTRAYLQRFIDAFTIRDLSTQMRVGEYTDSIRLINRYPIFGVGFTGTPDIDLYTDVAKVYLIMANQIGLVGVAIYGTTIFSVFLYGLHAWHVAKKDDQLDSIVLGYHAALLTALANATADLYFFRLDFQSPITLFWLTVTLALASSRLALERAHDYESTVANPVNIL
jgi:O-antigen ligase